MDNDKPNIYSKYKVIYGDAVPSSQEGIDPLNTTDTKEVKDKPFRSDNVDIKGRK